MESLKPPKSGSGASTPTGKSPTGVANPSKSNISVTVRFNAGDDSVESIYPSFQSNSGKSGGGGANCSSPNSSGSGCDSSTLVAGVDSLACSSFQQQINDEHQNRNNFLQGNFFNRKRFVNSEGISPTSSSQQLTNPFSVADINSSVGTWKLLKGKVTQTIEDIKSSKNNIQTVQTVTHSKGQSPNEPESDQEGVGVTGTSLNTFVNYDQCLDAEERHLNQTQQLIQTQTASHISPLVQHTNREQESDSDLDDIESSRLKRSLANFKCKVKGKPSHQQHHKQQQATVALATAISSAAIKSAMSRDIKPQQNVPGPPLITSASSSSQTPTSLRSTFLRKRRKEPDNATGLTSTLNKPEEPIPVAAPIKAEKKKKGIIPGKKVIEIESGVEMLEEMIPQQDNTHDGPNSGKVRMNSQPYFIEPNSRTESADYQEVTLNTLKYENFDETTPKSSATVKNPWIFFQSISASTFVPLTTIACLSAILMMPIHDFIRGVVATLLGVVTLDTLLREMSSYIAKTPPERSFFQIPDYAKMPNLEIPVVEEHKTFKTYSGWMNEVNSYDPNNFHISMSKSVYVSLEGSILRLSTTTARIPKKVLWNEPPIDLSTLTFTENRVFDLEGCRVELLPLGLAKKRYFNRKYPIQLIIRSGQEKYLDETNPSFKPLKPHLSTSSSKDLFEPKASESKQSNSRENTPFVASNSSDAAEMHSERTMGDTDMDFADTVLNADLKYLQICMNPDSETKELTVPRGDEVRLLLFSRGDREKEDWYRRFVAASTGEVHEQNLRLSNVKLVHTSDLQLMAAKAAQLLTNVKPKDSVNAYSTSDDTKMPTNAAATTDSVNLESQAKEKDIKFTFPNKSSEKDIKASSSKLQQASDISLATELEDETELIESVDDETYEGLIMSSSVARNPVDYVQFMANYQKACRQRNIPVFRNDHNKSRKEETRKYRRLRRQENELWKGIDQTLFLGPSGSIVWANVLMGRVIYSCLHDSTLKTKLQDLLQRKLSSIKLPSFMENVVITQIHLGEVAPLIHRVSQPMLDERGTWLDADMTYEGYCYITVTTKLNLLRLKRQTRTGSGLMEPSLSTASGASTVVAPQPQSHSTSALIEDTESGSFISTNSQASTQQLGGIDLSSDNLVEELSSNAIFDSDAESSGGSSSESESPVGTSGPTTEGTASSEGNARRLLKLVDGFTASNLFQYATEISYVQRAMENMNANITLRVDLRGLVARGVINLPPPPSDRIWLAFRGPPRLWITAKPTVGDKSVDWSIVTNVIESKLCEQVNRYLVYPNMVDVTIPFLGQPAYTE